MSQQHQFLDVIDRDEAERRFHTVLDLQPVGIERIELSSALGRVLAEDVASSTNVPSFDRSNFDGFALQAADTVGAEEERPREFRLLDERLDPGVEPKQSVEEGTAVAIATGGMIPRGADAVVMVEHCETLEEGPVPRLLVRKPVHPGFGISFAATDISCGETVLFAGSVLSSRATGILAAIGLTSVEVYRKPRVAIISTGDEIISPGAEMRPGLVYDSNARILSDAVTELGGIPLDWGIVRDDLAALRAKLQRGLAEADVVLLSGGTSKGQGDLSYHAVQELSDPGIVAHGVALKPGKPICLAASSGKPVVILPGFPTSAVFTFHEFVAPVVQRLAGRPPKPAATVEAKLAVKVNSEIGRTEYLLVGLVPGTENAASSLVAFPMGKGSGSVTTFSQADGFVTIPRHQEIVEADVELRVQLLGEDVRPADLIVIGSHCIGLDFLLGELQRRGWTTKMMAVGSTAGLAAAERGQCDLAGVHLLDSESGEYNRPFQSADLELIPGYARRQGLIFRHGDSRFARRTVEEIVEAVRKDPQCILVNRNQGSGTRILIDQLLTECPGESQPSGYEIQVKNHHAVAAAVQQGRADWGVAIESVVNFGGHGQTLEFLPFADEQFDFFVPHSRAQRPAVQAFQEVLNNPAVLKRLRKLGLSRE